MGESKWIYIQPYVTTGAYGGHATEYRSNKIAHSSRDAAIVAGFKHVQCDDFLIGEVTGEKIVRLWWMDAPRDDVTEVARVNECLGL